MSTLDITIDEEDENEEEENTFELTPQMNLLPTKHDNRLSTIHSQRSTAYTDSPNKSTNSTTYSRPINSKIIPHINVLGQPGPPTILLDNAEEPYNSTNLSKKEDSHALLSKNYSGISCLSHNSQGSVLSHACHRHSQIYLKIPDNTHTTNKEYLYKKIHNLVFDKLAKYEAKIRRTSVSDLVILVARSEKDSHVIFIIRSN